MARTVRISWPARISIRPSLKSSFIVAVLALCKRRVWSGLVQTEGLIVIPSFVHLGFSWFHSQIFCRCFWVHKLANVPKPYAFNYCLPSPHIRGRTSEIHPRDFLSRRADELGLAGLFRDSYIPLSAGGLAPYVFETPRTFSQSPVRSWGSPTP